MTTKQTYATRVLTARDHQLIDALERDPRYRKVAEMLRPPAKAEKPIPKTAAQPQERRPEPAKADPAPTPPKPPSTAPQSPGAGSGHTVGAMHTPDPVDKPTPKGKGG